MQDTIACRSEPLLNPFVFSQLPDAPRRDHPFPQGACSDHQFIAMLDAYRDSGGLAPVQEVAALFKRRGAQRLTSLASLIADNEVICFEWQSTLWLPLFQFNDVDMTRLPGLSPALATLSLALDPWQLANWFVQPHAWLGGATPSRMLRIDPSAVLKASHAFPSRAKAKYSIDFATDEAEVNHYA